MSLGLCNGFTVVHSCPAGIQCTITNSVQCINDWRLCCTVHMAWFIHETHNLMCRPDIIICGAQKEDSIQGRPSTTLSPALCPFTSSTLRLHCPWLKWLENQNTNNLYFTTQTYGSIIFREIKLSVGCHFENSSIYLNYSHHECRSCTLFRTERLPFKTVVPNRTGSIGRWVNRVDTIHPPPGRGKATPIFLNGINS